MRADETMNSEKWKELTGRRESECKGQRHPMINRQRLSASIGHVSAHMTALDAFCLI